MFPWNFSPFNKEFLKIFESMKPEEMEKYMYEFMEKMMPKEGFPLPTKKKGGHSQSRHGDKINWEVIETFDYIFVRIPVKEQWMKQMKIYITSNQLIIKNIPRNGDAHKIILPSLAKKKGAAAQVKNGMLEVKIPKDSDMHYSEIGIVERDS